ncbi:hypothetical protein EDD86DRAFT_215341 [Gorgonomyces haynaldii]|nr:hypothetical protein EDD86DRAFT_215341 [Gorgonomyces haynaldii]
MFQQAQEMADKASAFEDAHDVKQAIEAHFKAAEMYLLALHDTSDPEAIKTLKLLYASHTRQAKELSRKPLHESIVQPIEKSMESTTTDDPFEIFWENVKNLVDTPNTVAFTSQPLDPQPQELLQSYFIIPKVVRPKTMEEYQLENKQLKQTLDQMAIRLHHLEKTRTEHEKLAQSVVQLRHNVQKRRLFESQMAKSDQFSDTWKQEKQELLQKIQQLEQENLQLKQLVRKKEQKPTDSIIFTTEKHLEEVDKSMYFSIASDE